MSDYVEVDDLIQRMRVLKDRGHVLSARVGGDGAIQVYRVTEDSFVSDTRIAVIGTEGARMKERYAAISHPDSDQ